MKPLIRVADNKTQGVRTFYLQSQSKPDVEYSVSYIRRAHMARWSCQCPDFFHRRQVRRRNCKHIKALRQLAAEMGGLTKLIEAVRKVQVA